MSLLATVIVLVLAMGVSDAREPDRSDRSATAREKLVSVEALPDASRGEIVLPAPSIDGGLSVEAAISGRRSVRGFTDDPVTLEHLSQLLWAAQGITDRERSRRAAPSAGAKYPMEIFVVAGRVGGLDPGVYWYVPSSHTINLLSAGDRRAELSEQALSQASVLNAPLSLVIAGVYERTMEKYEERGVRYVHIEVGSVAENVYLQAESLGLGTVFAGAFSDDGVRDLLHADVSPLGIMPVGVPAR
jgi:SagB-type dehydrogenase family enzyme